MIQIGVYGAVDPRGEPCAVCTEPVLGSHLFHHDRKKGTVTHGQCSKKPLRDDFMKMFDVKPSDLKRHDGDGFGWVGLVVNRNR